MALFMAWAWRGCEEEEVEVRWVRGKGEGEWPDIRFVPRGGGRVRWAEPLAVRPRRVGFLEAMAVAVGEEGMDVDVDVDVEEGDDEVMVDVDGEGGVRGEMRGVKRAAEDVEDDEEEEEGERELGSVERRVRKRVGSVERRREILVPFSRARKGGR